MIFLLFLIACWKFELCKCCVINSTNIDLFNFILNNNNNENIKFTLDKNILKGDQKCFFTQNETMNIYIEDVGQYIDTLKKIVMINFNSTNNISETLNYELVILKLLNVFLKDNIKEIGKVCNEISELYFMDNGDGFFKYYSNRVFEFLLNKFCYLTTTSQNDYMPTDEIVYRGNFTSNSQWLRIIRNYYKNKNRPDYLEHKRNVTDRYIEKTNILINYFNFGRSYLEGWVDNFIDYLEIEPIHFSHYYNFGYVAIKTIILNPTKFKNHLTENKTFFLNRLYEKRKNYKSTFSSLKYVLNIMKIKGRHLSIKTVDHFKNVNKAANLDFYDFWNNYNSDYDDFIYFNGTTCLQTTVGESDYTYMKIFDYIVLHKIIDLFNPSLSGWTPTIKNSTSIFRVYMSRDIIKWIIEYVNRWRRSPYLSNILKEYGLEQDLENCKPGWPLYRDPKFGCPITQFEVIPYYFSQEEAEIIEQGNLNMCKDYAGILDATQAFIKYINAVISPYLSFPFLIPSYFVCTWNPLKNQLRWAYFEVDGDIKCYYNREDIPPFVEICLLLKSLILGFLVVIYVGVIYILIVTIIRCISAYNTRYAVLNRISNMLWRFRLKKESNEGSNENRNAESKDEIKEEIKE
jgi:hypothetical protein